MSGYSEEWLGNTDTTSTDIPIEPEVDNPGVLEIYRRMMAIELFQTQYGGWVSNLPLNIKVLMAVMLVMVLAVGIYSATVNWARASNWMDEYKSKLYEEAVELLERAIFEPSASNIQRFSELHEELLELLELHEDEIKLVDRCRELMKKTVMKEK